MLPSPRPALLSIAIILAGCSLSSSAESARSQPQAPAPSALVGAWQSSVQFTSGAFVSMKELRFLYVFNLGGTMTESSNYDGVPPVPPAYGVWREVGPNKFESKYVFYTTKPPAALQEIVSGGGWMPTGHGVLTENITLAADSNSYDSTIKWDAFDMVGKPTTGGGVGTVHATRIVF
jgi:hypothetical protein